MTKLTAKTPNDELPVVETTGLLEVKGGWVAVLIRSQGQKILETEILNEDDKPTAFGHAVNTYKVDAAKRFIAPQLKINL